MLRHLIQTAFKVRKRSQRRGWERSPIGFSQTRRLFFESLESRLLLAPVIGTSRSPGLPAASQPVSVSSTITDSGSSLTSVNLAYETSAAGTTSTVFTETFGTGSQVKPWSGTSGTGYADNTWTVTGGYCELNPNANDSTVDTAANSRGMTYKGQAIANTLTGAMTATSVNVAGMSGYVQFYFDELTLSGTDGWAFQLDPTGTGNSYTTCASDSSFKYNNDGWQTYDYPLTSSQLVNGLLMRFQFSGGGSGDSGRIYIDHITVTVTSFNTAAATTLPMSYANGAYSATIPAQTTGTLVGYYVTAKDSAGYTTTDPATAPTTTYSYTVVSGPTLTGTAQSPATVTAASPVWITTTATDTSATFTAVNLVYNAGSGVVTVPMYDDGKHEDGAAGDGMYGAEIPAMAAGMTVQYCISATDSMGLTTTDPTASLTSIGYLYAYTVGQSSSSVPVVNAIPGGTFTMGDEFNTIDPNHPSDETPLHTVTLNGFDIGRFDITDEQYCDFLNSALSEGLVKVTSGLVYGAGSVYGVGSDIYAETRQGELALYASANPPLTTPYSGIAWNGSQFSVLAGDQNMPVVGVYWDGAAAYCNWLSTTEGLPTCYTYTYNSSTATSTWTCNLTAGGYRLPTEAEWEYAADGGNTNPYFMYPWGDNANTTGTYANTLGSGSPYAEYTTMNQTGAVYPWTTPVGFYDGALQQQSAVRLAQQRIQLTRPPMPRTATACTTWPATSGSGLTIGMPPVTTRPAMRKARSATRPGRRRATRSARRPRSTTRSAAAAMPRTPPTPPLPTAIRPTTASR